MNGINIKFTEEKKKLPLGSCKLLGNPDVWEGFKWPQYSEDGEDYDLAFMCQINCADAAPFDKNGVLPKTGMLYFFYDMDLMPQESSDGKAAKVVYYNDYGGGFPSFFEMLRCDHEGNDMSLPEMKLLFHDDDIDREKPCGRFERTPNQELIFQIYPFETDRVSIKFPDNRALSFFVRWETHIDAYLKTPVTTIKTATKFI
jgi:hypothetical protein